MSNHAILRKVLIARPAARRQLRLVDGIMDKTNREWHAELLQRTIAITAVLSLKIVTIWGLRDAVRDE
jgi:hypothetical protein